MTLPRPAAQSAGHRLRAVEALAAAIPGESWFAACGDPLIAAETEEVLLYLDGLGFAGLVVEAATGWREAGAEISAPDWERRWWEEEERVQKALLRTAEADHAEGALYAALGRIAEAARTAIHGLAAVAAARAGVADPGLIRSAAGAGAMACHQQALVLAAGAGDGHPFAAKYRLFAAGRWPLAVRGGRFSIL